MKTNRFNTEALKLIRFFHQLNEAELAAKLFVSRQYLHAVEHGKEVPTKNFIAKLSLALGVLPSFFTSADIPCVFPDTYFSFRKRSNTTQATKNAVKAFSTLIDWLVRCLEENLQFPTLNIPNCSVGNLEDIECCAEDCRKRWTLGSGPISNMYRVAERAGVVVTHLPFFVKSVDALLLNAQRPSVVLNNDNISCCRQRFTVAHELGHLVFQKSPMSEKDTEKYANRFASALLLPRRMMEQHFPRPWPYFNWTALSEFKKQWKVSKAAILNRARQLDLINQEEYITGLIKLKKGGEAREEDEDRGIALEEPRLLPKAFNVLEKALCMTGEAFALSKLHLSPSSWKLFGLRSLSEQSVIGLN